jgi:hypothetical protein
MGTRALDHACIRLAPCASAGTHTHAKHWQASGATAVLLSNVFLSSTRPSFVFGGGSSNSHDPEVRRPLSFFAPDVRCVLMRLWLELRR